jgi:transcriptional regulator with XRE-family HTH domain
MKKQKNAFSIGHRLKEIRSQMRIQQKEMAATLKIAPSYLCEIENGNSKPGPDFFEKVASEYNVNLNYLFLGNGDMFGAGNRIKVKGFEIENGIESVEELLWLMENSKYFKSTILALANKTVLENEEIIKKGFQMKKSKHVNDRD